MSHSAVGLQATRSSQAGNNSLVARQIAPAIGAEVDDFNLGEDHSDATIATVRRLLVEHKVLVFRNQRITAKQQVSFARRFGELEVVPVGPKHPEHPELLILESGPKHKGTENHWHTDVTFQAKPPMGCVLHGADIPDLGGDTIWVNMALAYEMLPAEIKQKIEGLHAVHDIMPVFAHWIPVEQHERVRAENPPMVHPMVTLHPESHERVLFVNSTFTNYIYDYRTKYPASEATEYRTAAAELLLFLQRQAQIPEYQMRLKWEKDTVVFWDNRCTQHYALSDYFPKVRTVVRATIKGERPLSPWPA